MRVLPKTIAAPIAEPVTMEQLRGQVRVDDDTDAAMLKGYLIAARTHVENIMGRPIVPRTMRATFEAWPASCGWYRQQEEWRSAQRGHVSSIELMVPVLSVDAIVYTDVNQAQVPLTGFLVRTSDAGTTRVRLPVGGDWPTLGVDPLITLDCTSGFTAVPEAIVEAVLLLAAHFYLNREEVLTGARITAIQLPLGVADLLSPYRQRWIG